MDTTIIATIYSYEPIIASVTKFGANNLYLLVDNNPDETQTASIDKVKQTIGKYVSVHLVKTDIYDIVEVARESVKLIDSIKNSSKIMLNVSAARKTKAMGLMFAGYARFKDVENIFYITKEEFSIVYLPKIAFDLNKTQKKILDHLKVNQHDSIKSVYYALKIPKSTFYKALKELKSMGFVFDNKITSAGEIALL